MTATEQVRQPDAGPADAVPAPRRRGGAVLGLSVLAAVLPFVAAAVRVLTGRGDLQFAGDQALIGLAVDEASRAAQFLGPYSRYGWAHPGPSWFYAMVPGWEGLGRDDAALVAASLSVHAALAAGVVLVVHRRGSLLRAPLTAAVLAVLVIRLPASFFVDVWNPFALLLSTVLLLALAGRAARGRWSTLVWVAVVGSFLVQTHVGTVPLVGLVGLVAVAATLSGRRRRAVADRAGRAGLVVAAVVLVAMWVPPVVQQLTAAAGTGNLAQLADFFTSSEGGGTSPTWGQSLDAVGRVLGMAPFGWGTGPLEMDLSYRSPALVGGLVLQVLAVLVLLGLARRVRSAEAGWSAVAVGAALVAGVASVHTVTGQVYWYLVVWVAVLPAATVLSAVVLAEDALVRTRSAGEPHRRTVLAGVAAAATVLLVAGSVAGAGWSLVRAVPGLPDSGGVHGVLADLAGRVPLDGDGRTVHVEIATHELWPVATGVAGELAAGGWTIQVSADSADLFGADRVGDPADADAVVVVVASGQPAPTLDVPLQAVGTVPSELGPVDVLVGARG
ncbi:hypothetical protein [Klenkia sp. PcliD-1-E]|uniref:hypothetical protein n=1 Tax=Klenkia sp. PcliD-1-E TaxID=2954492 RepID=UPI002097D884|nr:hypothetical protein [Klenkia sp. PcliD-1-E]MCO7222291.1 hypothetical protein [Klenkia sp. PcliD-1-E]